MVGWINLPYLKISFFLSPSLSLLSRAASAPAPERRPRSAECGSDSGAHYRSPLSGEDAASSPRSAPAVNSICGDNRPSTPPGATCPSLILQASTLLSQLIARVSSRKEGGRRRVLTCCRSFWADLTMTHHIWDQRLEVRPVSERRHRAPSCLMHQVRSRRFSLVFTVKI